MTGPRGSRELDQGSNCVVIRTSRSAPTPAALSKNKEGTTMHNAMKRSLIAGIAIATAGLFGSLPHTSSTVAAPPTPTVHHDVALVDLSDQILSLETLANIESFALVLGPGGLQDQTVSTAQLLLGDNLADYLLGVDPAGTPFDYSSLFNGASTDFSLGSYLDGLAYQDSLNQLLGISALESQTSALLSINAVDASGYPFAGLTDAQILHLGGEVGTAAFNLDLQQFAAADFADAYTGFQAYLSDLMSGFGGLDIGSFLDSLGLGGLLGL